jgi:hypothetical protein
LDGLVGAALVGEEERGWDHSGGGGQGMIFASEIPSEAK